MRATYRPSLQTPLRLLTLWTLLLFVPYAWSQSTAKQAKPGQPSPISLTVVGNKLIVQSDDPEALELTQSLIRTLTDTTRHEGDFEIIPLSNARAAEAAKVLDEAFNGPLNQQAGQGNRSTNARGAGRGGAPSPNTRVERIRVVADAGSNSLLVSASPLDMLSVRQMIEKAIDADETDSNAVIRTWVLGPLQAAKAVDVINVIRDVYHEDMGNTVGVTGNGSSGGRSRQSRGRRDTSGNPRTIELAAAVDERTNSLVLACSARMHEEIKKLVTDLDLAAKKDQPTLKVVPLAGVDPTLIQQVVDVLQGRRPGGTTMTGASSNGSRFGSRGDSGGRGSGSSPMMGGRR